MIFSKRLAFLLVLALLTPGIHGARAETVSWQDRDLGKSQAFSMASSMSDEELLGQVFMIGFKGPGADSTILRWIREKHIGGVKIFGWNG